MFGHKLLRVGLLVACACAVLAVGLLVGSYFGRQHAEARRGERHTGLRAFLEKNLRGIEIGKPFPDFPLWAADGSMSATLHDLLPDGGVVFYVSSVCESCIEAVAALNDAILAADGPTRSVALIGDSKAEILAKAMNERGITLALYADLEDRLRAEHNVRTTRTFFLLGEGCVLEEMGTTGFDPDEYRQLISTRPQGS